MNFKFEKQLWNRGYKHICGIDEVGRGAWAGPIVGAGVIFDSEKDIEGIRDSKTLTKKKRDHLFEIIKEKAFASLEVYNILGNLVKTIVIKELPSGNYKYVWDATNDKGQAAPSGIYFSVLEVNGKSFVSKMVLLR